MRWHVLPATLALGVLVAGTFSTAACGPQRDCTDLCKAQSDCCAPQFGCDPDTHDMASCVSSCEALMEKDPEFEDVVSEQAACIEKTPCDEVKNGACAIP